MIMPVAFNLRRHWSTCNLRNTIGPNAWERRWGCRGISRSVEKCFDLVFAAAEDRRVNDGFQVRSPLVTHFRHSSLYGRLGMRRILHSVGRKEKKKKRMFLCGIHSFCCI
ncbi:hypothetical protein CEXT_55751 [Caerostris extrusa]|uniref:Uncharacterized protein n=1 Tax=Caerostris extrusa TaxID=172846 RepID=A0AAV4WGN5_CAEEX|nr:hypothetical protein CEXT_55751 [Caerostris extrusa]